MESFLLEYGVLTLAVLFFFDDLGFPLPTTTILFSSSVYAGTHPEFPFWHLVLVALIVPPVANHILFYIGRHGARIWLQEHGHRVYLTEKRMLRAEKWFRKYGEKAIFLGAMVASVRPMVCIIAGSMGINPFKFSVFYFPGYVLKLIAICATGYIWGEDIWYGVQNYWQEMFVVLLVFLGLKFMIQKNFFETKKS